MEDRLLQSGEKSEKNIAKVATCLPTYSSKPAIPSIPSIRASSRKNRVFVLREFLLRTYGAYLSKGATVLDVAGGKGDLSWLLTNLDELDSVVTDPRLPNHSHLIKSTKFLRENPKEAAVRVIPDLPTHQPLATLLSKLDKDENYQTPQHLRLLVDSDLVEAVRLAMQDRYMNMSQWNQFWEKAKERARQSMTLGYLQDGTSKGQILDASKALETICSARLIVGFHPDQATDACIDLALLLGIPFCVCPCCVFPAQFPHRQWNGQRVKTHEELIQYLASKHKSIRIVKLTFHQTNSARNTVLYTLPTDMNQSLS